MRKILNHETNGMSTYRNQNQLIENLYNKENLLCSQNIGHGGFDEVHLAKQIFKINNLRRGNLERKFDLDSKMEEKFNLISMVNEEKLYIEENKKRYKFD